MRPEAERSPCFRFEEGLSHGEKQFNADSAQCRDCVGSYQLHRAGHRTSRVVRSWRAVECTLVASSAGHLADLRRCIAVDLLAHGDTEITPSQDVSVTANANMLREFLDALNIDQVDLVGNDS